MNPYIPAGSEPGLTKEQIIEEEKKKLKEARQKIYEENQRYLDRHPEFRALLDDYVTSILNHKPADLVTFSTRYFQSLSRDHKQGPLPLIIAGPSGVGKGTLINRLLEQFPKAFGFSVSHTTRGPRPGEENGVHYFFVTQKDFEDAVLRGEFIEHAKVHTNYYGTSFQSVEKIKAQNKICILDIDVQGVQNVKASNLPCKTIFISPPSITELEHRLRGRGTETAEKIKVRLENAAKEMAYAEEPGSFDAIVVNDQFEETYQQLVHTLQDWYPEVDLFPPRNDEKI